MTYLLVSFRTSRINRMAPRQRHFAAQTTPQLLKPIENIAAVACRTASYCSVCFGICRMADLKRSSWTTLIPAKLQVDIRQVRFGYTRYLRSDRRFTVPAPPPTAAPSGADQFPEQCARRGDAARPAAFISAFAASRAMRFSAFFCSRSRRL